ncbi:MAG: ABC transporter ATP-binding protein [Thermotogae bacterium]|nr:ABC transporter ATP-binding protein [Thermotogota bacterium]
MDKNKLIEVKDLNKTFIIGGRFFGSKLVAVNKANLVMQQGKPEIFTLAGESGSGKTTLARMILGIIEPTSGHIYYKGKDVTRLRGKKEREWFKKEVQPIFQNPFEAFNPLKRVETYLFETALNFGIAKNKNEASDIVDEALKSVGLSLSEVYQRYPHELSGGQVQRTCIARALITRPSLLIADEPVSMVDASLRMSILNFFHKLKTDYGVSIIYITHDLATAYYVSDRIAIMYRGYIVELGPIEKVLTNPLHPYTQLLLDSIPKPDPDRRWNKRIKLADIEVKEYMALGCKFANRCKYATERCFKEEPYDVEVDGRKVKCFLYSDKEVSTKLRQG